MNNRTRVLALLLLAGCAVESKVRRVDSLVALDDAATELGADGWHVVAVAPQRETFVVVFERRCAR